MRTPYEPDEFRLSSVDIDFYLETRPWHKRICDRIQVLCAFAFHPVKHGTSAELKTAARRQDDVAALESMYDRAWNDFDKAYPGYTDRDTFELVYWFKLNHRTDDLLTENF